MTDLIARKLKILRTGQISTFSLMIIGLIVVHLLAFCAIDAIYTGLIKDGWKNDFVRDRENRISDFSQLVSQDVLTGNYPSVVFKAVKLLESEDLCEISVRLEDGYKVFSQSKDCDSNQKDLLKVTAPLLSDSRSRSKGILGLVLATYRLDVINSRIWNKQVEATKWFVLILCLSFLLTYILSRFLVRPLTTLTSMTGSGSLDKISNSEPRSRVVEIRNLESTLKNFACEILKYQKIVFANERDAAVGMIARQVAHDIRSPLAVLEMLLPNALEFPEAKRVIVRSAVNRIRDIANTLVFKGRVAGAQMVNDSALLLSGAVDSIVTEKRIQYRNHRGIQLNFEPSIASYGLFSSVEPKELKRALSNVIDNAYEALPGVLGCIDISIYKSGEFLHLRVQDNGKGIPNEVQKRIGVRGATFGKLYGSGLGLAHAKNFCEQNGGSLEFSSDEGKGTLVTFVLPLCEAPRWIATSLIARANSHVIILDDDQSIHEIWSARFDKDRTAKSNIYLHHCSNVADFGEAASCGLVDDASLLLVDFELSADGENGIQIIERLQLQSKAVLVTSRFEEEAIRAECRRIGIKIIPKNLASVIPLQISEHFDDSLF